jgi:imidazolonepropionase-like amidohydrolase
MAGCDPTGDGHVIAGLGDQRNIELLHEAGFSAPEAIRIATLNGATYLGRAARIGSLEVGKQADIVLLNGDLSRDISAIERPAIVFRNGVGYDSEIIYASLRGQVGLH